MADELEILERLAKYKEMCDKGIITEDEYNERKSKILESIRQNNTVKSDAEDNKSTKLNETELEKQDKEETLNNTAPLEESNINHEEETVVCNEYKAEDESQYEAEDEYNKTYRNFKISSIFCGVFWFVLLIISNIAKNEILLIIASGITVLLQIINFILFISRIRKLNRKLNDLEQPKISVKKYIVPCIIFSLLIMLQIGIPVNNQVRNSNSEEVMIVYDEELPYFNITYKEFCNELSEVMSEVCGVSEEKFLSYCRDLSSSNCEIEWYNGTLKKYKIIMEGKYVPTFYVDIIVIPSNNKVVGVEVFKAKESGTLDSFNMLANKISLILCGEMVANLGEYKVGTDYKTSEEVHTFSYNDCELVFRQAYADYNGTNTLRCLNIFPIPLEETITQSHEKPTIGISETQQPVTEPITQPQTPEDTTQQPVTELQTQQPTTELITEEAVTEPVTEQMPTEPVTEAPIIEEPTTVAKSPFESYLGIWYGNKYDIWSERYPTDVIVHIENVSGNYVSGKIEACSTSEDISTVINFNGEIIDNNLKFEYADDGWGNKGYIELYFNDYTHEMQIYNSEYGNNSDAVHHLWLEDNRSLTRTEEKEYVYEDYLGTWTSSTYASNGEREEIDITLYLEETNDNYISGKIVCYLVNEDATFEESFNEEVLINEFNIFYSNAEWGHGGRMSVTIDGDLNKIYITNTSVDAGRLTIDNRELVRK